MGFSPVLYRGDFLLINVDKQKGRLGLFNLRDKKS
jgi:hypothetical protein